MAATSSSLVLGLLLVVVCIAIGGAASSADTDLAAVIANNMDATLVDDLMKLAGLSNGASGGRRAAPPVGRAGAGTDKSDELTDKKDKVYTRKQNLAKEVVRL